MNRSILFSIALAIICLMNPQSQGQQIHGSGDRSKKKEFVNFSGIPLLQKFSFQYTSSDHHITQISVFPIQSTKPQQPGYIGVEFRDKNGDDGYKWEASFLQVDSQDIVLGQKIGFGRGKESVLLKRPGDNYTFVLRGFSLKYRSSDHHIDEVSITEKDGLLTVRFNDKNKDDQFTYRVDYAYVPNELLGKTAATGFGNGSQTKNISSKSPTVLRGFSFNFDKADHHIRVLKLDASAVGQVSAEYADKNSDDKYHWRADLALVRNVTPASRKLSTKGTGRRPRPMVDQGLKYFLRR